MVRVRGSRRGGVFRAKGSDGSPRNGWMVRTGVREGLQRKWFYHSAGREVRLTIVRALARRRFRLTLRVSRNGENIAAESPTARLQMVIGYGLLVIGREFGTVMGNGGCRAGSPKIKK